MKSDKSCKIQKTDEKQKQKTPPATSKKETPELAELKHLNESLTVNAEWQRSLLEAIGDAIISFDH